MAFYDAATGPDNFIIGLGTPRYAFAIFAKGYRRAASEAAAKLHEEGHFPDYDAYPIVFLYRHALELHLKNIIYQGARVAAFQGMPEIDAGLYNVHRLEPLADGAATILLRLFPDDPGLEEALTRVTRVAREFGEIDPDSFSYRYPIDRRGEMATRPHQCVSLRALDDTMQAVLDDLEAIDLGLDVETSRAQEIYEVLEALSRSLEREV